MPHATELPSFPEDVPTVQLESISLGKLIEDDEEELARLFKACTHLGFFYLNLASHADGREMLKEAEGVFDVANQLAAIPKHEREQYRSTDNVWG